jgi:hypothetical protein
LYSKSGNGNYLKQKVLLAAVLAAATGHRRSADENTSIERLKDQLFTST